MRYLLPKRTMSRLRDLFGFPCCRACFRKGIWIGLGLIPYAVTAALRQAKGVAVADVMGMDVSQGSCELPHHPASQLGRQDAARPPAEESLEVHVRLRGREDWQVIGVALPGRRRSTDVDEPDDFGVRHFAQESCLP